MHLRLLCILGASLICATALAGYQRRPLKEAQSENGRFELRVKAAHGSHSETGCGAALYEVGSSERKVWERPLVNDVAPLYASVRDDGRFVVTLDEFRRGGARNALAIYGEHGQLLRHFVLTDLLGREDWSHVKRHGKALEWLDGAEFRFSDSPEKFEIQLKWGTLIQIDLKKLRVIGRASGADDVPADMLEELNDEKSDEHAENDDARPPADAKENTIVLDGPVDLENLTEEQQRQVTEQLLAQLRAQAPEIDDQQRADLARQVLEQLNSNEFKSADAIPAADPTDHDLPKPDPANPVNYMDWLRGKFGSGDDEGAQLVHSAAQQVVRWTPESENGPDLQSQAIHGDPAALADPGIQSWVNANAAAIDAFHRSGTLPFQGEPLNSEDGSLIGILLPDLGPLREVARASLVRGQQLLANGDGNAAADEFVQTYAAGRRMDDGPTLIERLVSTAIQAQTSEQLMDLAASPAGNATDFQALAEKVNAAYRPTRGMDESIQMEKAFYFDSVQRMYDFDPNTNQPVLNPERAQQMLNLVASPEGQPAMEKLGDFNQNIQSAARYDQMMEAMRLPYPQARERLGEIEADLEKKRAEEPMAGILTPALTRAAFMHTRGEATSRAAALITNLRAYQQANGSYPPSLDAFGDSAITRDPFTGQRFMYRSDGQNFQLYSVGGNGQDDNGAHDPKGETNDIVYWPRPPKQP